MKNYNAIINRTTDTIYTFDSERKATSGTVTVCKYIDNTEVARQNLPLQKARNMYRALVTRHSFTSCVVMPEAPNNVYEVFWSPDEGGYMI